MKTVKEVLEWIENNPVEPSKDTCYTMKETLALCYIQWSWMAQEDGRNKLGWPFLARYGKPLYFCFCCEYDLKNATHKTCMNCPLIITGIWKKGCDKPRTLYNKWHIAATKFKSKKMKKIAAKIAHSAVLALMKIL